jgi:ribonucleotide monophosphatase NagD (HAD superfamily)
MTVVHAAAYAGQVNVGKGGSWLFPYLLAKFQLQPSRTAVVGDRLDTDIAMGKQGGLVTLLPLTGEHVQACRMLNKTGTCMRDVHQASLRTQL